MKKYNLSNSEEILMNMLWKENAPLTVSQLSEKITEADWKPNYVDKLVKQLGRTGRKQRTIRTNRRCVVQKRPQTAHAGTGRKADCRT